MSQNRAGKICRKKIQKHAAVDIFGRFGDGFFELSTVTLQRYSPANK